MTTTAPADATRTTRAQPESFRARSLGASLTVRDLARSVAWYRDALGFTVDQEMERDGELRAVRVKAGVVNLMLNQDDGAKGWTRVKGEGLSLMLTTAQSVDTIAERIKAQGGKLESEPADMPWGFRVFRVFDPDGFKLVIASPLEG